MTFEITATEASRLDLPAGVYSGQIVSVAPAEGEFGAQVKFIIQVDGQQDEAGQPLEAWAWSSQKLSRQSKLWRWIKALGGPPPVLRQPYDVERLAGLRCSLLVEREDLPDGGVRCRVKELLPPTNGSKPQDEPEARCSQCFAPVDADGGYTRQGVPLCGQHYAEAGAA